MVETAPPGLTCSAQVVEVGWEAHAPMGRPHGSLLGGALACESIDNTISAMVAVASMPPQRQVDRSVPEGSRSSGGKINRASGTVTAPRSELVKTQVGGTQDRVSWRSFELSLWSFVASFVVDVHTCHGALRRRYIWPHVSFPPLCVCRAVESTKSRVPSRAACWRGHRKTGCVT